MTDKVQKIREEVARIQLYTQSDVLKEVLDYIDKVQEEPKPKFKIGDCIKPIESSLGSPRTICEVCDSWYVTNQGTLDFEFEDNWELVEEPVSEPQVKESLISIHDDKTCKEKSNLLTQEPTIPDIVDEHFYEMLGLEPVSEDLEEAANEIVNKAIPPLAVKYKDGTYVGKIMDCFDRKEFIDLVKAGANWQKKRDYIQLSDDINEVARQICNKVLNCEIDYKEDDIVLSDEEECVKAGIRWQMQKESIPSKDLEELINSLSKQFQEVSFAKLSRIAVRVAKWQKEQMMAKAIDVEVKVDAGGYPYIPQMELYDYDNDVPLAKEGDKYKVVLIKED